MTKYNEDTVTVPRALLLTVVGMAPCETEWQNDTPRKGLRTNVHKPDCRPCALHTYTRDDQPLGPTHAWREGDRIRRDNGAGYGDAVRDADIRIHLAKSVQEHDYDHAAFCVAVLQLRHDEAVARVDDGFV